MVCGIGSGNIPKPGDPDNHINFRATPAYGGITLNWTMPINNAHAVAHFNIYRATTNQVAHAVRIHTLNSDTYFDDIPDNALNHTYYYWLETISINGTRNEFIGPVSAKAMPEVEKYLEMLTGRIEASALAQTLKTRIDKIEGLEDGITRQEEFTRTETEALAKVVEGIQASLEDVSAAILEEKNVRVTENEAFSQKLTIAQSQLGSDIASAQQGLETHITKTDEGITQIKAQYFVKLDVNGLVGGFGLLNDGNTIDAGFDVDRFWVGRSGLKIKPFIIENNIVYMNQALIKELTFNKLKDSTGQFLVQNGKIRAKYLNIEEIEAGRIKANQIDTKGLTIKDSNGNVIFGAGTNLNVSKVSGLGTLATQNTVNNTQVTGLGALATKNTLESSLVTGNFAASRITGLGALATKNKVDIALDTLGNINNNRVSGLGTFALLSKLAKGNIGTYMETASIGGALIDVAAIDSAHIKNLAVDTIKIKDNAVTDIVWFDFNFNYTNDKTNPNRRYQVGATFTYTISADIISFTWSPENFQHIDHMYSQGAGPYNPFWIDYEINGVRYPMIKASNSDGSLSNSSALTPELRYTHNIIHHAAHFKTFRGVKGKTITFRVGGSGEDSTYDIYPNYRGRVNLIIVKK